MQFDSHDEAGHLHEGRPAASEVGHRVEAIIGAAERAAETMRREAAVEAQRYLAEARERIDLATQERLRLLSAVGDSLLDQASSVKASMDGLVERLDSAADDVAAELRHDLQSRIEELRARAANPSTRPAYDVPAATPSPEPAPQPEAGTRTEPVVDPSGEAVLELRRGHDQQGRGLSYLEEAAAQEPPPEEDPRTEEGLARVGAERLTAMQMAVAGSTRDEIEGHLRREFGMRDPNPILDDLFGKQPI